MEKAGARDGSRTRDFQLGRLTLYQLSYFRIIFLIILTCKTQFENTNKNYNKICVVENIADQWAIESSSIFQGYFHILGGTIDNSNNQRKEDLLIDSLAQRVKKNNIDEIILATSATVEGQTTAFYIQDSLRNINVKISKLAQGLPVGGEIENLDDGTLVSAFKNRKNLEQ